ncbi:hypothetical protein C499_02339 [Halogeometricum borinquense DSM 11551]|uniref:VanZ-like domain-containing protein n=1 Tax=Halogeometricum borinquense (strain ATCC 700274 / DSM 11551 / JCM 10706 / KCTC 4070 / PR3) TaxID=469382 RepID=E4NPS5_HALBP|nr:hypothetical protein [Halogeometricum borinquense]ADQ66558.1 hypothetical protein Hbor_09640 [Halogeometricum borinquense DSM 11551]ELY30666.1 hypothetical protein C499_02339 [Halogeometricum borinquense DSM 11551]
MSLTRESNGADVQRTAPEWQFVVASIATRRTLAIATVFAAALGLLPLYESVWWWDLLTHTLAGAVITGWLLISRWRITAVLLFVACCSGAWEVAEYATPTYVFIAGNPTDTALDVMCNFVGSATAVAAFGLYQSRLGRTADGGRSHNARRPYNSRRPESNTASTDD